MNERRMRYDRGADRRRINEGDVRDRMTDARPRPRLFGSASAGWVSLFATLDQLPICRTDLIGRSNCVSTISMLRDASATSSSVISTIGGSGCGGNASGVLQAGLVVARTPSKLVFTRGGRDGMYDSPGGEHALWLDDDVFEIARTDDSGDGATLGAKRDEYSTVS